MILINEAVDVRFLGKESTRPLRGEKSNDDIIIVVVGVIVVVIRSCCC